MHASLGGDGRCLEEKVHAQALATANAAPYEQALGRRRKGDCSGAAAASREHKQLEPLVSAACIDIGVKASSDSRQGLSTAMH
jgi:hypothetical protein